MEERCHFKYPTLLQELGLERQPADITAETEQDNRTRLSPPLLASRDGVTLLPCDCENRLSPIRWFYCLVTDGNELM